MGSAFLSRRLETRPGTGRSLGAMPCSVPPAAHFSLAGHSYKRQPSAKGKCHRSVKMGIVSFVKVRTGYRGAAKQAREIYPCGLVLSARGWEAVPVTGTQFQ